jgi:hypothetical protein
MSSIGYRPRGADGPLYSPERDYAYITPTLLRQAIEDMEANCHAEWREANKITELEIVGIVDALAKAQYDFVNGADPVNTFEQALTRRGFYNFRLAVQQLLFASIGEVCCAAWFVAVREVSTVGEESPAQSDMARFAAAVRDFASRAGRELYNPEHTAESLKFRNAVLQSRIDILGEELKAVKKELAECRTAAVTPQPPAKPRGWSLFKRN